MTATAQRPKNYTTTIPGRQTAGECLDLLAKAGASAVSIEYDAERAERAGLFGSLRQGPGKYSSLEHAARVAWRVARDWLDAVLALVAAQMATLDEVMLPYLHVAGDRTLYQAYREQEAAALPAGSADA